MLRQFKYAEDILLGNTIATAGYLEQILSILKGKPFYRELIFDEFLWVFEFNFLMQSFNEFSKFKPRLSSYFPSRACLDYGNITMNAYQRNHEYDHERYQNVFWIYQSLVSLFLHISYQLETMLKFFGVLMNTMNVLVHASESDSNEYGCPKRFGNLV